MTLLRILFLILASPFILVGAVSVALFYALYLIVDVFISASCSILEG